MTESFYDLLGVESTATESEIKSAWRSLVTVLGPTDHRFASINDAASVLLDADKRTAYDATLAVKAAQATQDSLPTPTVEEVSAEPADDSSEEVTSEEAQAPSGEIVTPEEHAAVPDAEEASGDAGVASATTSAGSAVATPSSWTARLAAPRVAAVVAALAVALVIATSVSYLLKDDGPKVSERTVTINLTDSNVKPIKQQVTTRETADVTAALAAAVATAPKILDFDYRTIEGWQQIATPYMTQAFAKTYMPYFVGMVKPNIKRVHGAVKLRPILDAGVVSTAPGVVQVLIIVDAQTSTTNQTVIDQEFAILKMDKVDGRWLVDKFGTAPIPQ